MIASAAAAVRAAVTDALRADAAVLAAFAGQPVRIFDLGPPTNPSFPHLLLRVDLVGDDIECGEAEEATVTVDVYCRRDTYAESMDQADAIAHAVRRALVKKVALVGRQLIDWAFEVDRLLPDPDPHTAHRQVQVTYHTAEA